MWSSATKLHNALYKGCTVQNVVEVTCPKTVFFEKLEFRLCYPRDLCSDSGIVIRGTYVQILALLSEGLTFRFWQCYPRDICSDSGSVIRGTYAQILAVLSEELTFRFWQCYTRDLRSDSGGVIRGTYVQILAVLSEGLTFRFWQCAGQGWTCWCHGAEWWTKGSCPSPGITTPSHCLSMGHPGRGVNRSHRFLSGNSEVTLWVGVPALGHYKCDWSEKQVPQSESKFL